ncbi:DUF896 domain-containing protein [Heliobacterium gestii]|uniref:UPF0291 protein GTO89_04035 n=1 Tax=Heliomicrobium gestii TaxID=2699 RepID=A0A845L7J7_HELGE|nr:DUF896 domain-containing protein [Heliomicrobium gestii]
MTKDLIDRINYLSRKSRTAEGLTEEEKAEQVRVRREYVEAIKARVKDTLDRVEIVDADPAAQAEVGHKDGSNNSAGSSAADMGKGCSCPACGTKKTPHLH